LRIGICAPYDLSLDGGVNSHIRAQARALRHLGHHVSVFGAASSITEQGEIAVAAAAGLVVDGTESGVSVDPRAWMRVGRLLDRERLDVLHVHEPLMPVVPWCAVLRARVPVVGTFHAHRERGHRFYPLYRPLLGPIMRRVAVRIAVAPAARRTIARYFPGEYLIVPNGIEFARFRLPSARPLDVADDRRHVLFVGRIEPRKGLSYLIDAMATVQQRFSDVRLLIVGDGPDRDTAIRRARRANVDAQFAGRVPDHRLAAYYRAADVVCAPATGGESFGLVLLEAMAAGRAVVASRVDGYTELVGNAGVVRFVAPADAQALAREITALMVDPRGRDTLGASGIAFAAQFDWSAVAHRLEAIYYELASSECSSTIF
jgi:phosphatidylinositol alpha-mannosyltransferase